MHRSIAVEPSRRDEIAGSAVHQQVVRTATRRPHAVAVVMGDQHLTYGELNRRSGRLAGRLRSRGLGAESIVGILLDRSPELVVAVLGVLRAGGAYLPLDPALPAERLSFQVADSGAALLLSRSSLVERLSIGRCPVLAIPRNDVGRALEAPAPEVRPESLAYLIYTSGSTGQPKAVAVPHGGLRQLIAWHHRSYRLDGNERTSQLAGLGFDASVWEIWPPLAAGSTLHLADDVTRLSPRLLLDWLARERITQAFVPTPLAEVLLQEELPTSMALRRILTGGDRLSQRPRAGTPFELVNHYGPTECSVVATAGTISSGDVGVPPSIGRTIDHVTGRVLDRRLEAVTPGAVGELMLSGEGLARGYLRRPALTASSFVPDPWSHSEGARLYRTGDLVSWLPSGELAFLGRRDHQVKVRGHRIELGEIEALLDEHPAVRQAAVVARRDGGDEAALVAYVVGDGEQLVTAEERQASRQAHVEQWQGLYDKTYGGSDADPEWNFIGWNSSYTGEPIPEAEMREWVAGTVERIRGLLPPGGPRRVLEIGCGTGLLLFRLAPHTQRYVATDFSAVALAAVEARLEARGDLPQVTLCRALADELEDLPESGFDTLILNSVVQYFPNIDYLVRVLERATRLLEPGAFLFLGDLRSLPLHEAYCLSVELQHPELTPSEIAERTRRRRLDEEELLIDPAFFSALVRRLPQLVPVAVLPRRGQSHNELTRFRYDVILRLAAPGETLSPAEVSWQRWETSGLDLKSLRRHLEQEKPRELALAAVPNARLAEENAARRLFATLGSFATVGELRLALAEARDRDAAAAVDPEELWLWGETLPYEVSISWADPGVDGRFDVVFRRHGSRDETLEPVALPSRWPESTVPRPWGAYGNDPCQRLARSLEPELRRHLEERLPEAMLPASYVVLEQLPLTVNGKVDRDALPAPTARPESAMVAPRTPVEELICGIWQKVLGIERLGVEDNFMKLGGHSLLAMQVMSRLEETFGLELPLQVIFEAPTVAQLGQVIESAQHVGGGLERSPVEPVARGSELPLSYTQQEMWFFDQLDPGSNAFNVSLAARFEGRLDTGALARSLGEIVRRHEILRTVYRAVEGRPGQIVLEDHELPVTLIDLAYLPQDAREREARALVVGAQLRPFDLLRGPVLRARIVKLGCREHLLLATIHHIACDGWSLGIMMRELAGLYGAFVHRCPSPLEELPVQYADFAHWQQQWLTQEALGEQIAYWRERLGDRPAARMSADLEPSGSTADRPVGVRSLSLEADLVAALRKLSHDHDVTLFMTMLAASKVLLRSYTASDEVTAGTLVGNRNYSGIEDLIGYFVNTLPLRTDLSGDPTCEGLLARVRDTTLGAFAHQEVPYEQLVSALQPDRRSGRSSLFQVMVALMNVPLPPLELPDLSWSLFDAGESRRQAAFDLSLFMTERANGIKVSAEFDSTLFEPATAERFLRHFESLLRGLLDDPRQPLSALPTLSSAERQQLLRKASELDSAAVESNSDAPTIATSTDVEDRTAEARNKSAAMQAEVSARRSRLSAKKRALLAKRLRGKGKAVSKPGAELQRIPRRPPDEPAPLSFGQERLWFLQRLEPESTAYNLVDAFRLVGDLDAGLLDAGLQGVIQRHEVLRTRFDDSEGQPRQTVGPTSRRLSTVDLSALEVGARLAEGRRLASRTRPFDLARGPLFRALLIRLDRHEHLLVFDMHHSIADAWSFYLLVENLVVLYQAFAAGQPSPLPELPVQYADYAYWQRNRLQGSRLGRRLTYWKRQLGSAPEVLELPTDRPRPRTQSYRGATRTHLYPSGLTDAARSLGQRHDATLFMTLLAAFQALLHRHSGRDDFLLGSPITHRDRIELEPLVGFFVNTLVLRADLSGDPGFESLLPRVRETCLAAFSHQDLPFEKLVEELQPERDLSHQPLVQVMFVLQNNPSSELEIPGLRLSPLNVESSMANFDLTWTLVETPDGLAASAEYKADLFDASRIQRLLGDFGHLLAAVVADSKSRLSGLSTLGAAERQQVLVEWNDTAVGDHRELCLHHFFEATAVRCPDAVAVRVEGASLSYRELDAHADQLARRLRGQGVGPEVVVGVLFERSLEMVVAVLGVLKAGSAYLPLDPGSPKARLEFQLCDARAQVLLTQDGLSEEFPEWTGLRLALERSRVAALDESPRTPEVAASADNLAYVIYTSGSTGKPKGIEMSHRGVVSYLRWCLETYPTERGTEVPLHTSIAFDMAVTSLFVPLSQGGQVVLAPAGEVDTLERVLGATRATSFLKLTPAHMTALLETPRLEELAAAAGHVIVGGEALTTSALKRWLELFPDSVVFNEYGPTEAAVGCCVARFVEGRELGDSASAAIGRPIPGIELSIADRRLRRVPLGVAGELLIGGAQLARGYLGRPRLSAETFVPDPGGSGARLYRTGDLARYRAAGSIEFLGRLDHQVKLRGFRIELGEIEAVLQEHAAVDEAVVLLRELSDDDSRLLAYMVLAEESAASADDAEHLRRALRDHVGSKLPEYMVPSGWLILEALPLTASGKLDRRVLADLDVPGRDPSAIATAPRTPTEELLCGLWASILGLEQVGIFDSFFDLGGHSLLATRVIAQIQGLLGVEVPIRQLFQTPTVAGLADRIEAARAAGRGVDVRPIQRVPRDHPLPLSFAQERLWFLDQLQAGLPVYNIPVALELSGELRPEVLERSLEEVVRRHEVLRTRFLSLDGEPVQVMDSVEGFHLPLVELGSMPDVRASIEAQRWVDAEAQRPFDLARGPLMRAVLLRREPGVHVLLLTLHHIVSDGWSMDLLVREVTTLYAAFDAGESSTLPELPIQYADYASWHRSWFAGDELERQQSYWREQLAGSPAALELPADRLRPPVQTLRGAVCSLRVPASLCGELQALSRRQGATLFMSLAGSLSTWLWRLTSQDDVLLGSPVANRGRAETENLIGFFVNMLVLRVDLSGEPSLADLLDRVRPMALAAYDHQDLPFERLVEELQIQRALDRSPIFQVALAMQHAAAQGIDLSGLRLRQLEAATRSARYDLTLWITESSGGLEIDAEYSTDLFDGVTVERWLGYFETLLQALVASPDRPLSAHSLLAGPERHQLLVEWNDSDAEGPWGATLQELISRQAARIPEAVAVVFEAQALSYGELERRSDRLARRLLSLGAGPEQPIGVCLERSAELLVALLGVLKAGGAYVPLDPTYPAERLEFMTADSKLELLLTQISLAERFDDPRLSLVLLDADVGESSPEDMPLPAGDGRHLAYVIYTSGSTGRPKGVQIPQRALVNFLTSMGRRPGLDAADRLVAVTTLSFDISVLELFLPLVRGGQLVIAGRDVAADGVELAALVRNRDASVLQATPATWRLMLDSGWLGERGLKALCGGEAVPRKLADELLAREVSPWNVYGPTETTVWSAACRIEPGVAPVAFGRPVNHTQFYVVDRRLEPLPLGATGQLFIGGAGLSRGYLRRPALTAESFVPDPWDGSGKRLYRTGDLVRHLPDGRLDFLGRIDYQVKIRGFRIELGEVEAALSAHPALGAAVVTARDVGPGGLQLVAYAVTPDEELPAVAELRRFLGQKLPEYMVPAHFVGLETFPLTPSGKVDRRALPAPDRTGTARREEYAPPSNPIEEVLVEIWEDVLGAERVGIHDDFFELGGHSLLGVTLFARLARAFQIEVPLRTLFQAPTVAGLATEVAAIKKGDAAQPVPLPEITPQLGRRYEPFPLTDAQQAYWVGRSGTMDLGQVSCHVYVEIEVDGLDLERFGAAWQRVVDRHDMLRAIVQPDGQQRILETVPPYRIAVLDVRGEEPSVANVRLEEVRTAMSHQVLPADEWPLFEFRASLLEGDRTRLHLSFDLLIGDAWSFQILQREVAQLYHEPETFLPAIELSFRDYVTAERALESSEAYQRSQAYWRERLDSLHPAPELPLVRKPEEAGSGGFARQSGYLEANAWQRLKQRASQAGLTPSAVLLTVYGEVLATWSRSPRFSLVLTLFNRQPLHPQVDDLVGDFTSLTLLDIDMSGVDDFETRGRRLQQRLWEDLDHRHWSSVRVLRELIQSQRWNAREAIPVVFTSTLNMRQAGEAEPEAIGLRPKLIYSITQTPQVLVDHQVSEDAAGNLLFAWDAVEELFPEGLIAEMFGAYRRRLEQLAEDEAVWAAPSQAHVPQHQLELRAVVNATAAPVPEALLDAGFRAQARQQPQELAVIAGDQRLTYGELSRLANRTGHRLRQLGVRPNQLVAVVMEKGWQQVVAVLGIHAAGSAYLPIDPGLPAERREHLLERGGARWALTVARLDETLEWPDAVGRLAVDREEDWQGADASTLEPVQKLGDLAYVIFTSGSTGDPKGVAIDHRGAANTVADINRRFSVGPRDRVLALSALNFDLSVYDVFGLLAAGGTIVLPAATELQDPASWVELMNREKVTLWNSVPALMQMATDYAGDRRGVLPDSLRLVMMSGDWIPVSLPDRIRSLLPEAEVISMGGATEASIWSIIYPIEQVDPEWPSIPYGRPMANQTFHVLDEALEPCPAWVPGDLFIGGIGLALGYWRDEEKTTASFFEHPRTGERLYRTGDMGRYLPSGDIEFLGREDAQVKIQGYRIELGEIETHLAHHPAVKEAVAAVFGQRQGEKRLVGYVVPEPGAEPSAAELQDFLREKIPSYMVPPSILTLDALPLSANGKVNRKALPEPGVPEREQTGEPELANPLEERMIEMLREIFPDHPLSVHDNFFGLGGTSISAVWLVSRVREEFDVELPLGEIFQAPTLRDLATVILQYQAELTDDDELAEALAELEGLSDEEVEMLLAEAEE